jgi:hypothetical protein
MGSESLNGGTFMGSESLKVHGVRVLERRVARLGTTMPLRPFSFMPRRRIVTSAFVVGAVVCALPLVAQRADSLTVGAKIRVQRAAPVWTMVRGTYVTRDSVSFVLDESDGSGVRTNIPMIEVKSVEMSVRQRTSGEAFKRGAGRGALVGIGVGAILMTLATISDARDNDSYIPARAVASVFSVLLTGVTTLVGGGIGLAARDQWREVPFRP